MKKLVVLSAIFLGACAGQKTITVKVPIAVPCKTPQIEEPVYPKASADAGIFERVKVILAELELRKGYEAKLMAAAASCGEAN